MSTSLQTKQTTRIVVPQRPVNGGFDFKFEADPYYVKLYNLLTAQEYTECITRINDCIKPARQKSVDNALLGTGILMVPLAIWGVRHNMLSKKRKRLLKLGIDLFNADHPQLHMRWNRRPDSILTIERSISYEGSPDFPNNGALVLYEQQQQEESVAPSSLPPSGQYVLPGGRPNFRPSVPKQDQPPLDYSLEQGSSQCNTPAQSYPISSLTHSVGKGETSQQPQHYGYLPQHQQASAPAVVDLLS